MTVGLAGTGPAAEAVRAAVADADREVDPVDAGDPDAIGAVSVAVVVDTAGAGVFERADRAARETDTPWVAVELGGVGGVPLVPAAVSTFGPTAPCYDCLTTRVSANADPDADPVPAPAAHTARLAGAVAGYEVARWLDGAADVLGRVLELSGASAIEREVLPVPGCACAEGDRETGLELAHVERDVEAALTRAERGVDERVGLVAEVGEAESFPVPYYLAQVCETTGFSDAAAERQAAGVDADWDAAFMKAVGEAFERYCAGVYRRSSLPRGLPEEVEAAVPPSAFVCRSEPDATAPLRWVPGENLSTGGLAHLPAALTLHPPPTERFRPPVTTGLGLGNGTVGAVLAGLFEVVERDAAMLSWYSSYEPLGLSVEDAAVETLTDRARSEDLTVSLTLLTQDVDVPVVAAAVAREAWPRFALGSGAHLDVHRAARSALAEALQNWTELRGMGRERAREEQGAVGRYADRPPSVEPFVETETTVPASTLDGDPPTGRAAVDETLDRLATAGLEAYAARLTTRDVAALGFEAVRVVVPPAQPLFLGEPYFSDRAESVPAELGFAPRLDRDHHPFP